MYKNIEDYREYQRNYYIAHKTLKYDKVKKNMRLLSDYAVKQHNKELSQMLLDLGASYNEVFPLKQKFEVPQDLINMTQDLDKISKFKITEPK